MVLIRSCSPTQAGRDGGLLPPSIMALTLSEIVVEGSDPKVDTRPRMCDLWGSVFKWLQSRKWKIN